MDSTKQVAGGGRKESLDPDVGSSPHGVARQRRRRVLVVDDDTGVRVAVGEVLSLSGLAVKGAATVPDALRCAEEEQPDLILCDIEMTDAGGYGLLLRLGQNPQTAPIPVIVMTARGGAKEVQQALRLGACDCLIKPFGNAVLLESIQRCLGHAEQTRARDRHLASWSQVDALTGLPNQLMLRELFEAAVESIGGGSQIVVMTVAIDRWDELGAARGVEGQTLVVCDVARRLALASRKSDTIARLSQDAFAVLARARTGLDRAHELVRAWTLIVNRPERSTRKESVVSVSVGAARFPEDGYDLDFLVRKARTAAMTARANGGGCYSMYLPSMTQSVEQRLQIEADLVRAIKRGEFRLHYQPLVSLVTGSIAGAEALVRWQHPERGLTMPLDFIQVAEEAGLMPAIGELVLAQACAMATTLEPLLIQKGRIAVNISARQLEDAEFVDVVETILKRTGLPAARLDLEVTESVLMSNLGRCSAVLEHLRSLGVTVSIDDFGTGYSSLGYLRTVPFDNLKLDRMFIRGIELERETTAIVRAVSEMTHVLGKRVVAEGVETSAASQVLRRLGCDLVQGFLYSRPVPEGELHDMLVSGRSWVVAEHGPSSS
jgi:diguanylate cyclase (GGDEF)-like protein